MALHIKTGCVRNNSGGKINGTILFHTEKPIEVEHLSITLSGRAQTDIDQSSAKIPGCIFQGRRVLFATRTTLIKQSTVVQGTNTWSFDFQIPRCCTARESHKFRQWDRFDSNPEQQLPPAFASSLIKPDGSHAANAAIVYELGASMLTKETRIQAVEPLNFTITRSVENPPLDRTVAHAEVALRSAELLTTSSSKPMLHLKRLKVASSTKTAPFLAFRLALQGPRGAIVGQRFPLHLSVDCQETDTDHSRYPPVYLQTVKVTLNARTSIRCSGSKCFSENGCLAMHKGDEFEDWDEELLVDSCDLTKSKSDERRSLNPSSRSSGLRIPETQDAPSLHLGQYTTIPSYFVPSFKSFIISRNYALAISIDVRCAGKSSALNFVTRDFMLLAHDFVPRLSQAIMDSATTNGSRLNGKWM
ncbi:MAG: hypothetical protein Q9222_006180 [Ikaeria aurantiellina]